MLYNTQGISYLPDLSTFLLTHSALQYTTCQPLQLVQNTLLHHNRIAEMSVILSVAIPLDLVATIRNTNDIQEGINTLNSLRKTDVHSSRVVAQLAQAVVTSARSLKYDIKDKTLRPISSPLEDPFSPSVVSPWAPVVWGTKQTAESPVEVVKESINIAVQDDAGGKLFFKMRPYTSIGKLISRYCEAKSVSESELVFSLLFVDLVQKYGRQSSVTQVSGCVDLHGVQPR